MGMAVQLFSLGGKCQTDGSIIEPGFRYKKSGYPTLLQHKLQSQFHNWSRVEFM
jgi:hypothetical protein